MFRSAMTLAQNSKGFAAGASLTLTRDSNQAVGIAQYAIDMLAGKYGDQVAPSVYNRVRQFHTDSVLCGVSALALKTNAPTVLRAEAIEEYAVHKNGAFTFGSDVMVSAEKAVVANSAAVREWDSNGTVFGYRAGVEGHQAGEFGHNDFYPVVIAAAQQRSDIDGRKALLAMVVLDEIRGRLAEVFSLKTYKIDHVVHGAIASAAVYGALCGATPEQIEHAIGMVVAHYIPYRAIRAGKQLSDSKGSSAALSTEVAVMSMKRAMRGFIGPKDIFRNPEAIFRWNEKQADGQSPFNIMLATAGDDFAVMGMHFKLGLYEHQSAGALHGLIQLLAKNPSLLQKDAIKSINIVAYEPAFGIIGDPAKRNPTTRQSADHSMVYIVSTLLRKAQEKGAVSTDLNEAWKELMLSPFDYGKEALYNQVTRQLMEKISFTHGGKTFDDKYPEGIPTEIEITDASGKKHTSGMVMFPFGHARAECDLQAILDFKNRMLGEIAFDSKADVEAFIKKLDSIENQKPQELKEIYKFPTLKAHQCID